MPIYEYRCGPCGRKTTALVMVRAREHEVRCAHCGAGDLTRLWSRFATPRSEEARLDALADAPAWADVDESDPSSVARAMQKMGEELGEPMEGLDEAMSADGADADASSADDAP